MLVVLCLSIRSLETGCYIVAHVFVAAGMCLPSHCLALDVYSGSTIPAFRCHVTISSDLDTIPFRGCEIVVHLKYTAYNNVWLEN
jgi:hypothetical protein